VVVHGQVPVGPGAGPLLATRFQLRHDRHDRGRHIGLVAHGGQRGRAARVERERDVGRMLVQLAQEPSFGQLADDGPQHAPCRARGTRPDPADVDGAHGQAMRVERGQNRRDHGGRGAGAGHDQDARRALTHARRPAG
jgi:hypothetical protein